MKCTESNTTVRALPVVWFSFLQCICTKQVVWTLATTLVELQVCATRLHVLIVKMALESNSEVCGTTGKDKFLISARPERDSHCTYKRNISRNHCRRGEGISITYSECVFVALDIQHAKRMIRVILSFVAWLAVSYFFPHYFVNGTIFGGKVTERKMFFWFSVKLFFLENFSF